MNSVKMKQTVKKYILGSFVWVFISIFSSPVPFVFSEGETGNSAREDILNMNLNVNSALPSAAGGTLTDFFAKILVVLLQFVGTLGILIALYGGFRLISAQGNEQGIKKGQNAFLAAAIGIIIVLTSYVLVSFIQGFLITH